MKPKKIYIESKEQALKPCPFCGCKMKLKEEHMIDGKTIRYSPVADGSHKRGCQLEFASSAFVGNPTTKLGAIKKWNRRVDNTE